MSEITYTPGPWEMNVGIDGAVVYHPDQGTIADIPMDLSAHPHNARLIAAAPELLEALEDALEKLRIYEEGVKTLTEDEPEFFEDYVAVEYKALAAIAKAKGE